MKLSLRLGGPNTDGVIPSVLYMKVRDCYRSHGIIFVTGLSTSCLNLAIVSSVPPFKFVDHTLT